MAALRDAGHTIGIALSDRNVGIFVEDAFTHTHVLERIPWPAHGSTPETATRAREEIAAAGYDAAIIVSEEPEAYELAQGIPERIGFTNGFAKILKSVWIFRRVTRSVMRGASVGDEDAHEAEIIFRLGEDLVATPTPSRDAHVLRPFLLAAPVPERTATVVQLGEKWRTIGVRGDDAAAIARGLAARGAHLIASASEAEAALTIAGDLQVTMFTSLSEWKAEIDRARAVVTPDTGAAHLAGMLGVPVVDIFPDADARAQMRRWHPWAAPYATITASELRVDEPLVTIERALDGL